MPFSEIKALIDILKDITKLFQEKDYTGVQSKVIELQTHIMGVQNKMIELQQENSELKAKLKETTRTDEEVFSGNGAVYKKEKNGTYGKPHCNKCWHDKKKFIPYDIKQESIGVFVLDGPTPPGFDVWVCPSCKNKLYDAPTEPTN